MKNIKSYCKLILIPVLGLLPFTGVIAQSKDMTGKGFNEIMPHYDSIRRLPIDGVNVIEVDGRLIFTSTNGRFVFNNAELYDTFNRRHLKTPNEIAEYSKKIDLDAMGIDASMLNGVSLGSGSKRVTMFVDPMCGYCAQMLSQVVANPKLWEEYTFDVIGIAMLGEQSNKILTNLMCAEKMGDITKEGYVKALAHKDYSSLKDYGRSCDEGGMQRAMVTARLLGARGVPFVVSPSGTYVNSMPPDIAKFLKENEA